MINNDGQKTEIASHPGSGQGKGIWFVQRGREHVLEWKKSACSWKEGLVKHLTRESRQKPFPWRYWVPCHGTGQWGVTWNTAESGWGKDNLTCRANRTWHLHKALGRRGGLPPHFRQPFEREGSRVFFWQKLTAERIRPGQGCPDAHLWFPSLLTKGRASLVSTLHPKAPDLLFFWIAQGQRRTGWNTHPLLLKVI